MHPVELGVFTPKESIRFIKKALEINDDEEAEKLHEKLQALPLALQQAVAYIKQQRTVGSNFGIQDYLKEYDKKAEKLLSYDLNENNNDPYMKTVMTTWKVTLDKIENDTKCGKEAIRILSVMAYLVPDNIKNSIFSRLVEENKVTGAINLLRNYSMINQGSKVDLSNIHRLVQEVLRIDLKSKRKEEKTLEDAFSILDKKYNTRSGQQYDISNKDYKTMSAVLICTHAMQYPKLQKKVQNLFSSLNTTLHTDDKESSYLYMAGRFLYYAVKYGNKELVQLIVHDIRHYCKLEEEKKWKEWQTEHLGRNILLNCKEKGMMECLKQLGFDLKITEKNSAIVSPNCKIVLEFLMECNELDELEKSQLLEQAILEAREDVVELLLKKQPDLALKKVTRAYLRGSILGYCGDNHSSILEFAGQCYEKINKEAKEERKRGKRIISLIENVQVSVKGHYDNELLDLEDDFPSTRETSISSSIEVIDPDEDEMESDTESLLSVGNEDSDFEMIDLPSNTSDDEEELGYVMVDSTPRGTLRSLSVVSVQSNGKDKK